jgi:Family of unknown function (DUF6152)
MRKNSSVRKAGWLLMLGMCTSTAWAHHGGGTFDATKCFVFQGAVRQVAWANPHAWVYVQVDKGKGAPELWGFEFGTVAGLSRAGFRPSDFAIGTKVKVTAYANRDMSKHTGSANRLILPDGRDVSGAGIAGTAPSGGPPGAGAPPPGAPPPGAGAPPTPPGAGAYPPGGAPGRSANCPEYK